ncbi:MAG TPA: VOC family protein [Vicinamibacterales bacterium]|nr:VOC family protein [Vicinamibacterales bacterium]
MPRPFGIAPPGFQLPDETHVGAVRLQVGDLRRSLEFYSTVLGLRVLSQSAGAAALGPQADGRPLVRLHEKPGVTPAPRRGAFGLYHFAILLPERAALGRFTTHLAATNARVGMADHLVSESLYLSDPDGLGIEVYADRPPSTWRHADRELAMTTDPLDVRSLIAAGGDRPWEGAPAGTTMGHLHLHVGSLDQAEAFYHAGLGLDKTVWGYPGALFLSAGGYHHHLGTNTWSAGPAATDQQARLLEWELILPRPGDAADAAHSLRDAGYNPEDTGEGWIAADPWGTQLRIASSPSPR